MFGRKTKQQTASLPAIGQTAAVVKATKVRKLRATVFPQGGGSPYEQDVEPDDQGIFTLGESGKMSYTVTRGSVCTGLDGMMRIIVHEGNPQTINGSMLSGDPIMHPSVFHAAVNNNLLLQQAEAERNRGFWKQAGTYGLVIVGIVGLLMMLWQVKTIGGGLEGLQDAMQAWGAANAPQDPEAVGHTPIGG